MLHEDIVSREKWANVARWKLKVERARALNARWLVSLLRSVGGCRAVADADLEPDLEPAAHVVMDFLGLGRFCRCPADSPLCVRRWPQRMSAMIDLILCPKDPCAAWHRKECIDRTCAVCGDDADGNWRGWRRHGVCSALRRPTPDANCRLHEHVPHRNAQAAADGKKQLVLVRHAGEPRDVLLAKYIEVTGFPRIEDRHHNNTQHPRSLALHRRPNASRRLPLRARFAPLS